MPDVIYYVTRQGICREFTSNNLSQPFAPPDHFLGVNARDSLPPDVAEMLMQAIEQAIQTRTLQLIEYRLEIQGEIHYREGRVVALSDAEVLVLARDITDSKRFAQEMQAANERLSEANAQMEMHILCVNDQAVQMEIQKMELEAANLRLEGLATTDGLTGLKNHRKFQERILEEFERVSRYGLPLSLILLDVDKFKQYNDTYGHPAGDGVLKQVADIISAQARNTDVVARYGGEEFAIILPQTNAACAMRAAERFRRSLEQADWPNRAITASLGVASFSLNTPDKAALIAQADQALYRAKEQGRNRVTHYEEREGVTSTQAFCLEDA